MPDFKNRLQQLASQREYTDPDPIVEEEVLDDEVLQESEAEPTDTVEPESEEIQEEPKISNETLMILEAFDRLCNKIDELRATPPVVNIPAPIIEMIIPETRKVVQKVVQRDEKGDISTITESIIEGPSDKRYSQSKQPIKTQARKVNGQE